MMNQRLILLRSAARRKQLLSPIIVPRLPFVRPQCRLFASAQPLVHEQDDKEEWKEKEKKNTLKRMVLPQSSSLVPPTASTSTAVAKKNLVVPPEIKNDLETSLDTSSSPSELTYTGNATMPITTRLHIVTPDEDTPRGRCWPVFRLMDEDGTFRDGKTDGFTWDREPNIKSDSSSSTPDSTLDHDLHNLRDSLKEMYPLHAHEFDNSELLAPSKNSFPDTQNDNTLMRAYRHMIRLREMDTILQNAQRQGRISFYMTCLGEEAIHIGSASALNLQDVVLAQYREAGLLMWRGFTLEQFTDQCFSNNKDLGKGRQMPVHYGSRALNYQTISSPLGTQIPQAAGAAYRLKLAKKDAVAVCFFGDGCASTTDFHSGLNFAATLGSPVIFFCRNNGYAISTPVTDQYAGDGIVSRGPGYGMAAIRIDGNDIFAVHAAVREARKYALKHNAPVLIEAMCYRQGHHSTSDDSLRYRSAKEIQSFADRTDPIARVQKFLQRHDRLSESDVTDMKDEEKMAVIEAMGQAERKPKPALEGLFEDVYEEMPQSLKDQHQHLKAHLKKYPKEY